MKTCKIKWREEGQRFGCRGQIVADGKVIAETRIFPWGSELMAKDAARDLASEKGYREED